MEDINSFKMKKILLTQNEIDELYIKDNVCIDKRYFEIENLNKEVENLSYTIPTAEERLLNNIFGTNNKDDNIENQNKIKNINEQIAEMQEQIKDDNVLLENRNKYRVYPSKETEEKVFLANLYIVDLVAKKYSKKSSISYDDFFQTGCEGLLSACHYYLPLGTAKFSTYASKCIENKIKRTYFKNRRRKLKNINWIKSEIMRMNLVLQYLEELIYVNTNKSFVIYDYYNKILASMQLNFNTFNKTMFSLGYNDKVLPKIKSLDSLSNFIKSYISNSKINDIITDEDKKDINLISNFKTTDKKSKKVYEIYQIINIYTNKLKFILLYAEAFEELSKKGDVNDDDIYKEINKKIKKQKKLPFLFLDDYNQVYADEFGSHPFASGEYDDEYMTKSEERRLIREAFEEEYVYTNTLTEVLEICEKFIKDTNDNKEKLENMRVNIEFEDFKTYDFENDVVKTLFKFIRNININKNGEYSLKKAIRIVKNKIEEIKESDLYKREQEFVKKELKRRKDIVNQKINERNLPKIKINRERFESTFLPKKKIQKSSYDDLNKQIKELFLSDSELVYDLIKDDSINKRKIISIEDQVLNNSFLEDYYSSLQKLSDIQKYILLYWFDENGIHSYMSKEIAQILNIDEKLVIKEKNKALKILKKDANLKSYLDN